MAPLTRRRLLASAGAGAAGIGLGAGGYLAGRDSVEAAEGLNGAVPFYGEHQAGIVTPAQDRIHFAAFDLFAERRSELRELMREWSRAAAEMCAPPVANLTLTFGFGPSLFEKRGLRLRARRPAALKRIPPLPGDELEESVSGGDVCVQACADDAQVAFHAIRDLARIGRGAVAMRWSQLGFGRTSSSALREETRRNLLGFREGTNNLHGDDEAAMRDCVWVGSRDHAGWMRGGTYMVTRRIRMLLEAWDRSPLEEQEQAIGRAKYSGAPLGGRVETDDLDLSATSEGRPVVPDDAHVRLAFSIAPEERILRRGYSFSDGLDERSGELDAGTFFVCFQRDPARQFVAIQSRLATSADALNRYIRHVGGAVFAIPPGARPGGYVGEGLLR
jgi:deferrochelatase/peroxidase EfeB